MTRSRTMVVVEPFESAEIVRRGWALYDARIRSEVEAEHDGRFLVIDVDSGRYVLADEELEAFDRAREEMPSSPSGAAVGVVRRGLASTVRTCGARSRRGAG